MIALFTDFGYEGPYVGQMKAVLHRLAPGLPVVDLMHDAPAFEARAAGYLLAATVTDCPADSAVVAVVDPGVGTERRALVARAGGYWFTGPDNGLLDPVCRLLGDAARWQIEWRPPRLSASFHGRDLFAPVAARLALGETPQQIGCRALDEAPPDVPSDWSRVIYADRFGNLMTGLRAAKVPDNALIRAGDQRLRHARTFGEMPPGTPFWYANSSGLVELAVNRGSAAALLGLAVGDAVEVET